MGQGEKLMEKVDQEFYRASGVIPPEEVPDEGHEYGPTTSQQMERLYQEQREVQGCLWLVIAAAALLIATWLYLLWRGP